MDNWITLLYTWNWHKIVNQLYSNENFKNNKIKQIGDRKSVV